MGCYLEDYRARVGNWAARTPWRHAQGREVNRQARSYIGNTLLCAAALAIVLVFGGVEQNPGPVVEAENILQVLCSRCERNLKSGTQCDTCGRWFHNSCGNLRAQMAESGKKQIEELKRKNSALEDQLRGAVARGDTVQRQQDAECLVLGDSIIRNVEAEHMRVQCFPGIRTEQLQRVIDNTDLGAPNTVVIHVGTSDLRRTGNLDYVMGDVYALVKKAKTKFPQATLVLSGVLRRRDVSWRRIGAQNDIYDWVAMSLGVTFVDPNSLIEDWDFGRDGLHINSSGARKLGQLYSRVCDFGGRVQNRNE
ncbi:hypothetical protein B7P43_G04217 [Cryptotermes secundus]|uniref:SGNH hydrolase-type esterase domain-containing protein n=1 Tax=Cryptotermes secundus TaxID=105785 RepID=A0A2J7PWD4_9NEOP|nr:hypothetical protein B7P43_G04217 [Cryptotermes secundus]